MENYVNDSVADLREYNRIQDKRSDELQSRVIEVVNTNQKNTIKIKNIQDATNKLREEMDRMDLSQFVLKKDLQVELRAFQNMIHEIKLASDEKYLFKAVYKEFNEDCKTKLSSLR